MTTLRLSTTSFVRTQSFWGELVGADKGIVVESKSGSLYCQQCRDFVYDPTLEPVRLRRGQLHT